MDFLGIIVDLVSGAIGGNVAGAALKDKSLGVIGNSIAGAVGGTAGSLILKAVDVLNSLGMSELTLGAVAGGAATSLTVGGIVTAIIAMIKAKV